jgi:CubicO group peptidase (beta-lactamase class C family)
MKKNKINRTVVFVVAISVLFACSNVQQREDDRVARARAIMEQMVNDNQAVGLAITIIKDGKKLFSEGVGYADLENQTVVDPATTMFRIGSVSKSFTSTALAKLYEEGKVELNADARKYVPQFPAKKYTFTVKQVAGHLSGIRHYNGQDAEYFSIKRYKSIDEALTLFADDTLLFKPGEKYRYSSFGYNLLSAIIEGASGQNYLDYLQTEIFDELGMNHTSADYVDSIIIGRAGAYELDTVFNKFLNTRYVDNSYKWAGGGFLSTSEDIAKFAWAFHNGEIVNDTTKQLFTKAGTLNNGEKVDYALGWTTIGEDAEGNRNYGHGGTAVGGSANMRIYPDANMVMAFAKNTWKQNKDLRPALAEIANLFIKD